MVQKKKIMFVLNITRFFYRKIPYFFNNLHPYIAFFFSVKILKTYLHLHFIFQSKNFEN